ncbi:MAG: sulfite exporter TauE/SafE family protein [Bacillota bacterium]
MGGNILKVKVSGLHCRSCEILSEEKLMQIPEVKSAKVSHLHREATIDFGDKQPNIEAVRQALRSAGYDLDEDSGHETPPEGKNKKWKDMGLAALIATVIFIAIRLSGLSGLQGTSNPGNLSFAGIVVVGLVAGISTCMALVGGIVMAISADYSKRHPQASAGQKFLPHLYFNAGRIAGFFILGGLLGALGLAFKISISFSAWLTLLIGFLIAFIGLQVLDIFPALNRFSLTLPKRLGAAVKSKKEDGRPAAALISGALSFFLPCGFTQSMQILALSSGSFIAGASIMSVFALGTAPGLLGIAGLMSAIKGRRKSLMLKTAGLVIIIFGLFNINNGYKLISLQTSAASTIQTESPAARKEQVQVIRMEQNGRGYTPTHLEVEAGRPVRWIINSTSPFSCASSLIVPALDISQHLKKGENVIEFTADKPGKIGFSCSMGMYRGYIDVIASK